MKFNIKHLLSSFILLATGFCFAEDNSTSSAPIILRRKIDTPSVDYANIVCKLVNGRRNGLVQCGFGKWTNSHLEALTDIILKTGSVPLRGKLQTTVRISLESVRRLSFTENADINNSSALVKLIKIFPNLLELDVSFTGFEELPVEILENKVGAVDIEGTSINISHDFFVKLTNNLKEWNPMVFLG